jgi:hypothetical protein
MKRILLTIAISAITTLLTLAGALWWLSLHSFPLPTTTEKDGTVIRSRLLLARGLLDSTIWHNRAAIPLTRSVYLFDPENTVVFDNGRDHTHHRVTVQTHPLPGMDISKTYHPEQAAPDKPLFSRIITNYGSPNEVRRFFDETGAEISAQQYDAIVANNQ